MKRHANLAMGTAAASSLVLAVACQGELAPYPGARVAVDTDLPVPRAVERLRVDIYDEAGVWLETRDYPRLRPEDWPATFSVFTADELRPKTLTLRLRAYSEGAVRDYRGPRYTAPPTFSPTATPTKLSQVCAGLPLLPPGQALTQRRGAQALTDDKCDDQATTRTGAIGARVEITEAGRYRFEVVRATPDLLGGVDTTLFLRRDCARYESELGCADDIDAAKGNFLSRLVLDLEPGSYALLTGGTLPNQPADLTLQWDREDRFVPGPAEGALPAAESGDVPGPRLMRGGVDITPSTEPLPSATVDQLVRVKLVPGQYEKLRFTLHGACAGTEAHLVFDEQHRLRTEASTSCSDTGKVLVPPLQTRPLDDGRASAAGRYLNEPCGDADSDDQVVCVPGGAFVMGDPALAGVQPIALLDTLPSRIVGLTRFYMDRREVTVGRYRQARAEGLPPSLDPDGTDITDAVDIAANDSEVMGEGPNDKTSATTAATYSKRPRGREAYPLEMVSWTYARRLCNYYGGDLPSEAQWEYAATAAGRPARTRFPWGEEDPGCARVVAQRTRSLAGVCPGIGPTSVEDLGVRGDVTPLGIEGMGGNVAELVRDAAARYDAPCWQSTLVTNPECVDPGEPYRLARGGSWLTPLAFARGALRGLATPSVRQRATGFRCVYLAPPERRWSGP